MKKQILSWLLVMCMICSLLPATALAVEGDADGKPPTACTEADGCTLEAGHEGDCVLSGEPKDTTGGDANSYYETDDVTGGGDVSKPTGPACTELEGCNGDTHAEGCPLYVAPVKPDAEPEETFTPVAEPAAENGMVYTALLADDGMTGNCGAQGSESSVTWELTENGNGAGTYTLTISGAGAMMDYDSPTSSKDEAVKAPWYAALTPVSDSLVPITQIVIGDGITYVGSYAFAYTSVTTAGFNQNTADYGAGVYAGCKKLTTVDWTNFKPTQVQDDYVAYWTETGPFVPFSLFDQCEKLTTCKIGNTTYTAGTLVLPANITGICTAAFRNTGFSNVDFFDGLYHIKFVGPYGLASLSQLKSVTIPKNVTFYPADKGKGGARTFTDGALETVTIQSQGTTIAVEMFYKCTSLKTVHGADNIAEIGQSAFSNSKLESFSSKNVKKIGPYAFLGNTSLTSLTLGAVEEIGLGAFAGCSSLKTVAIEGSSGLAIPDTAFGSGTSGDGEAPIESFTLENGTPPAFTAKAKSTLKTLVLGDGVNWAIPNSYCANAGQLESVTLGKGITSIGDYAFYKCSNLSAVTLPADGQLTTIGVSAFSSDYNYSSAGDKNTSNSPKIQTIDIPASVTSIGKSAFSACMSLNTVRVAPRSSLTNIGTGAFLNCFGLQTVDLSGISDNAVTFNSYAFGTSSGTRDQNCILYVTDDSVLAKLNSNNAVLINAYSKNLVAVTNGGTFAKETQFGNTALSTPAKEGGIFVGWYKDSSFTNGAETPPQAGQTYYAKWIGMDDMELQYGSSQKITVTGVQLSGFQSDRTEVATVDSDGTVTAKGVGTATITANGSYQGQSTTFKATVTVTPMPITFGSNNDENPDGTVDHAYDGMAPNYFDYAAFYPATVDGSNVSVVEGSSKITLTPGKDVVFVYNNGAGEAEYTALPVDVTGKDGLAVTVKLLNPNYQFVTSAHTTPSQTVSVTVKIHASEMTKEDLNINGDTSGTIPGKTALTYNGQGQAPISDLTGVTADGIDKFTVHFHPLNSETVFEEAHLEDKSASELTSEAVLAIAPKEPGQYLMIVNGIKDKVYAYASVAFSIEKAAVTVKADDKSAYVGDEMPDFTYTVTGLVGGDTLGGTVMLVCGTEDTSTAGNYTITPGGGEVDENRYTLAYENGTLTVSQRPSGGGGSSSGSSGNVTGSGDDVNIDVSGSSVTAAQMEKAVDKADRGETITIEASGRSSVSLPSSGLQVAADNNNGVTVELKNGEVTLSPEALAAVAAQAGATVTLTVDPVDTDELNSRQREAVGDAPVFDLTIKSGGKTITDFDGGLATVSLPYELPEGQDPAGVVVWFMDDNGNITPCETMYDLRTETVIFTTRHFSKYVIGYQEPQPFTDVDKSAYYADAVAWAVANNITSGTSATTFSPNAACTRAQMVTFLWRAAGEPKVNGSNPFTDVAADAFYYDAVLWAVSKGITSGTSATTFSPDATVTRGQTVTFLYRAAGAPAVTGANAFTDVAADAFYASAVQWAVQEGITSGTSTNTFSPDNDCTRGQIVTFLYRYMG